MTLSQLAMGSMHFTYEPSYHRNQEDLVFSIYFHILTPFSLIPSAISRGASTDAIVLFHGGLISRNSQLIMKVRADA